jgi:hypothetical protein
VVRKAEMVIKRDDETTSRRQKRYASLSKKMKEGVDKKPDYVLSWCMGQQMIIFDVVETSNSHTYYIGHKALKLRVDQINVTQQTLSTIGSKLRENILHAEQLATKRKNNF